MNDSSDDSSNNQYYSKFKKDEMVIKQKRKASSKKYVEKKKMRNNILNMTDNEKIIPEQVNADVEEPRHQLNESISSLLNESLNETSSVKSNFDCSSSCNTSILDQTDENIDCNNDLLPLYKNSTLNYDSFIESYSQLIFKHKLSDEAANDFLSFLSKSVLPGPNNMPKSVNNMYKNILEDRNQYINKIYFCKSCQQSQQEISCNISSNDCIYFITLDVVYQIQSIISRVNIREKLKCSSNNIMDKDVLSTSLDGSVYQDYLQHKNCDLIISLCLNTDGAPLVVSKGMSLWPVIAKIIELPDNISESFENLIFVGLWLDNQKPAYDVYMAKCVEAILSAINSPTLKKLGK